MGNPKRPETCKLVCALLYCDEDAFVKARSALVRVFGRIDYESPGTKFSSTDYYADEMGHDLKRKFLGFEKPVDPGCGFISKLKTNSIEKRLSVKGKRKVNIDPGLLSLSKFVLFTTKDYSHRIYIGRGIYAEVTLYYQGSGFKAWPWTYPDYRQDLYIDIFNGLRSDLKRKVSEADR